VSASILLLIARNKIGPLLGVGGFGIVFEVKIST
jgi:hypothetical protein